RRRGPCPPAAGGRRGDENGERIAGRPRRDRGGNPRARGRIDRRRRAAHRYSVNVFTRIRRNRVLRYLSLSFTVVVALLAAAVVVSVTVDLGPSVRGAAEKYGSRYIERPPHIG